MSKTFPGNLACPLDGESLRLIDGQLRCPQNHSFDIARQGYVNLLPVQHKRSRDPGDSKDMIVARQRFLDIGVYQPIAEAMTSSIRQYLPEAGNCCILDAGCGEGYYLDFLRKALDGKQPEPIEWIGLDISKPAIQACARRNRDITWLVASNKQLPVLPESVDIILSLFGFPVWEQFARALKPGGRVVLVEAGPDHLIELRQIIYEEVKQSPPPSLIAVEQQGLQLTDEQAIRFQTPELTHDQLRDLLTMTPHLYRASQKGKEAALQTQSLIVTADILLRTLSKQ